MKLHHTAALGVASLLAAFTFAGPIAAQSDKPGPYAEYAEKYWKIDSGQKVDLGEIRHMGKTHRLIGWLTKPSDALNQPAVIYMGGCNGFDREGKQYMAEHLTWLREEGYVVLNVDGLTPRGITREGGYCDVKWSDDNPLYVRGPRRATDAMVALTWLAEQPFVDRRRIGYFGFSAGANAGFSLAVHYAESYDKVNVDTMPLFRPRFKAIFAIYPRCFDHADYNTTKIRTNTMINIGELDTSSRPEWCKPFKAVPGVDYNLKILPGVYHSYMNPHKAREIVWADGKKHWFAPDPKAKAETVSDMKAWFTRNLKQD